MSASKTNPVSVTRMSGFLGARVDGVDISSMDDEIFACVRKAFDDHAVICVTGQSEASSADYVAFARRWGEVQIGRSGAAVDGRPEIGVLPKMRPRVTDVWHTDLSFQRRPPLATILRAMKVPPAGGDTLFASQVEAYRQLSSTFQRILAPLEALHVDIDRNDGKRPDERERAVHPIVRMVEGQTALYVNGMYTSEIVGMTKDESEPILRYLFSHCTQPNFIFRQKWTTGDIVVWDNRRVQHFAMYDYGDAERIMHRMVVLEAE